MRKISVIKDLNQRQDQGLRANPPQSPFEKKGEAENQFSSD